MFSAFPAHHTLLDLTTIIILGEEYEVDRYVVFSSFLLLRLLGPNIPLVSKMGWVVF
jgi:hypothetical protein